MKKIYLFLLLFCFHCGFSFSQEVFSVDSINRTLTPSGSRYYLAHPYEITYGPDDSLYITEKIGRVRIVSSVTGQSRIILDYRANVSLVISRNGSGAATSIGQNGMMGLALHKDFKKVVSPQNYIYIAYSYNTTSLRISRFTYNTVTGQLGAEVQLINGLSAGNDHSSGRLVYGPDDKLYYSCGDQGANQFASRCNPILAQTLPDAAEISANNYSNYSGKILRINLDGSIPSDNPLLDPDGAGPLAAIRSHIYTYGHRNPQGLSFEMDANNGSSFPSLKPGGFFYSSEHGIRTDDEINLIASGSNYGWPYWAGFRNNPAENYRYINWSTASGANCSNTSYNEVTIPGGAVVTQENAFSPGTFTNPIFSMYPACNGANNCAVTLTTGTNWMQYPTIAPSGIEHYGFTNIPGWYQSLLVPTLRRGTLYRYKLNASRNGIVNDSIPYFFRSDRYRDLAIKNGNIIFTITDSIGQTSGPSGSGTAVLTRPGTILKYTFLGYQNNIANNKSTLPVTIDVSDGAINTCNTTSTVTIDATNYNLWVPLTGPDGNIAAEIYANGNVLGTVTGSFYKNSGGIRIQNGKRYLDRNITITPQNPPNPLQPVRLRLYFSKVEFDVLDADALSGISSINDIRILKNDDPCGGVVSMNTAAIVPDYAETHGTNGYVVQTNNITGFSSFYFGSSNITLPVGLITFTGSLQPNGSLLLNWKTANEQNSSHFIVERSADGNNFNTIGRVAASGTTTVTNNYSYTDNDAAAQQLPQLYYRLKIVDNNGEFSYSNVVVISFASLTKVSVYPVPAHNSINVNIVSPATGNAQLQIIDNSGHIVLQRTAQLLKGVNDLSIDLQKLATGFYYLKVRGNGIDKKVKIQKL